MAEYKLYDYSNNRDKDRYSPRGKTRTRKHVTNSESKWGSDNEYHSGYHNGHNGYHNDRHSYDAGYQSHHNGHDNGYQNGYHSYDSTMKEPITNSTLASDRSDKYGSDRSDRYGSDRSDRYGSDRSGNGRVVKDNNNNKSRNPYQLVTRRIDNMRIRQSRKQDMYVDKATVKDLDYVRDIGMRCGAIIYTYDRNTGEIYFGMGVDTQSGNLTDFGGGVKRGETIIEGGLRELWEESQGVFGKIKREEIENINIYYTYDMAVMFIYRDVNMKVIQRDFKARAHINGSPEVCEIVWMTREELLNSINGRGRRMYIRVQQVLSKITGDIEEIW